jgi:hypothetical protein
MNLAPSPIYTKQTKCNNNLNLENTHDFFRPIISNISTPINYNHDNYMVDQNAILLHHLDLERSSVSTRNNVIDSKKPVQADFQNNYYTMSFDSMNHHNNQEINKFLNRNPVNTRRDNLEKSRNVEKQDFLKSQGGILSNFTEINYENTRQNKNTINSSNYIPMPRTMAIPKENI